MNIRLLITGISILLLNLQILSQTPTTNKIPYGDNVELGKYFISKSTKIYYEIYGEGDPLILLHGNHGSIVYMHNQISFFSKYYKVITIDNRNHGKSDKRDTILTYELMAHDVLNLIDTLKLQSVNVLGWSDGANIGLQMSRIAPQKVSKLVMMAGNYKIDTTVVDISIIEDLQNKVSTSENIIEKSLFRLILEYPKLTAQDLQNIHTKTLIISADSDIIKPTHSKEMHKFLPNSELFIVPASTHMLPLENPQLFNYLAFNYIKTLDTCFEISGKVSDTKSKAIKFVNIGIKGKPFGTTTYKDGRFKLKIPKYKFILDSLYISSIGYEAESIPITDFIASEFYTIKLNEKAYEIKEVIVKSGKLKTKTYGVKRAGNGIIKGVIRGSENAILITSKHYPLKIKQINFGTTSSNTSINYRVKFYSKTDSLPGEIIMNKKLVFSNVTDEKGWITCNLSTYNIFLEQDFFAAMEILPDDNPETTSKISFIAKMVAMNPTYSRNIYNTWENFPIGTAINVVVEYSK